MGALEVETQVRLLNRKRRGAVSSGWIIISVLSGVVSYVFLYMAYLFIFPAWITTADTTVANYGEQCLKLSTCVLQQLVTTLTTELNISFVLIAVSIFIFMLFAGFRTEPSSSGYYS